MVIAQLEQAAEDWPSGNLWQALDLWRFCPVEVFDGEINDRYDCDGDNVERHLEMSLRAPRIGIEAEWGRKIEKRFLPLKARLETAAET